MEDRQRTAFPSDAGRQLAVPLFCIFIFYQFIGPTIRSFCICRRLCRLPLLFWTLGRSAEAAASNYSRRGPFSCIFYPVLSGMSRILHRMICFEEKEASCAYTSYFQKAAPWGQDSGGEGCSVLKRYPVCEGTRAVSFSSGFKCDFSGASLPKASAGAVIAEGRI